MYKRFVRNDLRAKALHARLAAHFAAGEYLDERKASELPWQYEHSEQYDKLRDALADMELFHKLVTENMNELTYFWRVVEHNTKETAVATYTSALSGTATTQSHNASFGILPGDLHYLVAGKLILNVIFLFFIFYF